MYVGFRSKATFTNSTISGNTAQDRGGGVVVHPGSEAIFEHCSINENRATKVENRGVATGGGIYNDGKVTFRAGDRSEISGNSAYSGGGIFSSGADAELVIADCDITGNVAESAGGGIALAEGASIDLDDVLFSNNLPDNCLAPFPIPACTA